MLETVDDLIPNKKIPALKPVQMPAQLQYVVTSQNASVPPATDETAHRRRDYLRELEVLLAGTLPLARPIANALEVNQ